MLVKELYTDKSKWTQNAYARDAEGKQTFAWYSNAVCWCIEGAIQRCYPYEFWKILRKIQNQLKLKDMYDSVLTWNDAPERKFEDIQQLVHQLNI